MAKDQSERFAGAAELAEAVQRWLADEPLVAYRDFVSGLEKLVRDHPAAPEYQEQLARNRTNLGLVLGGMGRAAEAEAVFRTAIAEYEALTAAHPRAPAYRADLAAARAHLSRALIALGRRDEAKQAQREAAADYEKLMAADPLAQDYHSNLARVMLTLAPGALQAPPDPTVPGTVDYRPEGPAAAETLRETGTTEARGHFTLLQEHARGGMSRIWVARDNDLNREVAIKELRPEVGPNSGVYRLFLREAQITAQLQHPNIIPVYGLGHRSHNEAPFLVMPLVRGTTFQAAIAEHHRNVARGAEAPAGLRRLLNVFVTVCQTLDYAHRHGVVHRDPKSANVLLGQYGEILVVDWGLAKLVGREDDLPAVGVSEWAAGEGTRTGSVLGTPAYMAPEQARGLTQEVDARTDVYVLGALLFEVLTGQVPHAGQTVLAVLERVLKGPTPSARAVNPAVPPALDAICARAMARAQADRYPSAAELGQDVERWLAGEAVSVYAESWFRRLRRRLRV
jgi:serine/threonine protein kinase